MSAMLHDQWASRTRQRRGHVARSLRGALPLGALLFSGCALLPEPYGEVAPDAAAVRPGGQPNVIPANAPSIMNGHWAGYDGHEGIDVIGQVGLPVIAPADGDVVRSFFEPMYGHAVFIRHADRVDGTALRTRLVHLDERLVEEGDAVVRGQQIGTLGRTGLLAGGIAQALITTAAGLTVAIPSLIGYRYYRSRVDTLVVDMEKEAIKLVEALQRRKDKG